MRSHTNMLLTSMLISPDSLRLLFPILFTNTQELCRLKYMGLIPDYYLIGLRYHE